MLPAKTSQAILTTINHIINTSNARNIIPLPSQMKTIIRKFESNLIGLYTAEPQPPKTKAPLFKLLPFTYKLPIDIFPNHQKAVTSYAYDIIELLMDICANISDPTNCICTPDIR